MKGHDSPHIELFMYSLNQEFPVDKGHTTFLKKRSEARVDDKSGRVCAFQEVESQVFSRNRIADEDLPPEGVKKQPLLSGGKLPTDELLASLGAERLAAEKVPLAEFDPEKMAAFAARPWTAQWAQNGWVAQWAQNTET